MSKKLFVGNLVLSTTAADLESLFATVGTVESAAVVSDADTGRSRGFGFVDMSSEAEATKAVSELNGRNVGGRRITVAEAMEPDSQRSMGGGQRRPD